MEYFYIIITLQNGHACLQIVDKANELEVRQKLDEIVKADQDENFIATIETGYANKVIYENFDFKNFVK